MRPTVFLSQRLNDQTMSRLDESCDVRVWQGELPCPLEAAMEGLAGADGALGHYHWTGELMDCSRQLRIIANIGVGYDNVDVAGASSRGIVVTNTPDVLTESTADLTFALLMATARGICAADRFVRRGKWTPVRGSEALLGSDVHHATLGVVGLGRIGSAVARRAAGFDMQVLYYDLVRRPELETRYGFRAVDLDTLLASADFVTLHVPLSPTTRQLIGRRELSLMKAGAFLINASRGPVVDETALIEALREGSIAGAGLDVFASEPVALESPLLLMENVVVLPHIGSATVTTRRAMQDLAADNVLAVLGGGPPLTPVNPEVLTG